jgi:hypothetical protein
MINLLLLSPFMLALIIALAFLALWGEIAFGAEGDVSDTSYVLEKKKRCFGDDDKDICFRFTEKQVSRVMKTTKGVSAIPFRLTELGGTNDPVKFAERDFPPEGATDFRVRDLASGEHAVGDGWVDRLGKPFDFTKVIEIIGREHVQARLVEGHQVRVIKYLEVQGKRITRPAWLGGAR